MLSQEAVLDREWAGLSFLRSVLEPARRAFDGRHYPTSIATGEFDDLRRLAYLAALVTEHRNLVLAAVVSTSSGDETDRQTRAIAARNELERLGGALHHAARHVRALAEAVNALQRDVVRVHACERVTLRDVDSRERDRPAGEGETGGTEP